MRKLLLFFFKYTKLYFIMTEEPDDNEDYFADDREQTRWNLKRRVPQSTSQFSPTSGEAMNETGNADTADGLEEKDRFRNQPPGFVTTAAPTSTPMKQLESLVGRLRLLGSTRSSVLRKKCVQAALDKVFDVARWIPTYQRILEERDTLIEHQSKLIIDKLVLTRERDMAREKAGTNAGEIPETRPDDQTRKEHREDMPTGVRAGVPQGTGVHAPKDCHLCRNFGYDLARRTSRAVVPETESSVALTTLAHKRAGD
ncbi:hypothetical protein GE061_015166, partial [Apolygus lucorum]